MYEQSGTGRMYKEGESGFALVESFTDTWEQTNLPNEALKGDGFAKNRGKKESPIT